MPAYENLVRLTDEFCDQHLNAEYAELCRQMAAALCSKRASPLVQALRKPGVAESFIRLAESISCSTEAKPISECQ